MFVFNVIPDPKCMVSSCCCGFYLIIYIIIYILKNILLYFENSNKYNRVRKHTEIEHMGYPHIKQVKQQLQYIQDIR